MNGKIYIGSHKTCNLNDEYMGSGKYLNYAIKKHGIDNFVKEILFVFGTPELMYAKEAELVTEDFLSEVNTYNLKVGGFGGWDYVNRNGINNQGKDTVAIANKISKKLKGRKATHSQVQALKERHKSGKLKHCYFGNRANDIKFGQLAWSPEATAKRNETRDKLKFQKGKNNSQYGTCWICHKEHGRKKIKKEALPEFIAKGWIKGGSDKVFKQEERRRVANEKKKEYVDKRIKLAHDTRSLYKELGYASVRKFVRDGHYNGTNNSLLNLWRKYIKDFKL